MSDQTPTLASCLRSMFVQDHFQCLRDGALLRHFVEQNDSDAFVALMRRHGPMILGLARRVVRDQQLAEDVFQATFLVLSRKARAIRGQESLPAWLHSVAFRLALRAKKSRKRFADIDSRDWPASQSDPSDDLARRESLTILDEELHKLPDKYRVPLILCHLEGLSQEAAAKRLNVSPGSLKGRLERGRALLRTMLARRGLGADTAALGVVPSLPLVSPVLVQSTLRAAMTGKGASLGATALASGAIKMMFLAKLKTAALAVLLLGAVGWGAGWVALGAGGVQKEEVAAPSSVQLAMAAPPVQAKKKAVDLYGDPLPEGAVMRFGTVQLRAAGARLAITDDGKTLVGLRGDRFVTFWDAETGKLKETKELEGVHSFDLLSHDGQLLTNWSPAALRVFHLQSGKAVNEFPGKYGSRAMSWDGNLLAASSSTDSGKIEVHVWDLANNKKVFVQPIDEGGDLRFGRLFFTPNGKQLIASCRPSDVGTSCWDVATGKLLWQSKISINEDSPLAFTPNNTVTWLAGTLDLATGQRVMVPNLPSLAPMGRDRLTDFATTPDLQTMFISSVKGVRVWDLATVKETRILENAGEKMVVPPDGKSVITNNGSLQRWDLATGKSLYQDNFEHGHLQDVVAILFSADGKRLASGSKDGSVRLWDATTGHPIHVWRGHEPTRPLNLTYWIHAGVQALDMTPDGHWIVSAGSEGKVQVWDGNTGRPGKSIALPDLAAGQSDPLVYHLRISPDGKEATGFFAAQLAFAKKDDGPAGRGDWQARWDLEKGALMAKQRPRVYPRGSLSRDGKTLVSGAMVADMATGRKVVHFTDDVKPSGYEPDALSLQGDLVAGHFFRVVKVEKTSTEVRSEGMRVWETATGQTVTQVNGKQWHRMAFHPKKPLLAVSEFPAIEIRDLVSGKTVWRQKVSAGPLASFDGADCTGL